MGIIEDLFGSQSTEKERAYGIMEPSFDYFAAGKFDRDYSELRSQFAVSFERWLGSKSQAEQARMKAINQQMIDAKIQIMNMGFLVDPSQSQYREARRQVEKDLNLTKAEVYDKVGSNPNSNHKSNGNSVNGTNQEFDNSSSRMRLRPFDGQRLNLEGTVDTIEFADHDGQMQATIKNVSVATPSGTVRYNHVNFFVDEALGDTLLSRQGSKVAFSGKVTLYDRGHRSTDKGSAAKAYGFSDIRVK